MRAPLSPLGVVGAVWGIAGVLLLVGNAIVRLGQVAYHGLTAYPIAWWQWALTVGWAAFMLQSEGYRGFQKGFSPRVVARALHLARAPRLLDVLLAPLFCMGYFRATRKRMITSYAVTAGIVLLVVLVRQAPQPWRGMIDAGVVLGLAWGVAAILAFLASALSGRPLPVPTDVPEGADGPAGSDRPADS